MNDPEAVAISIRPAICHDSDAITVTYLQSAEYHSQLDPERYSVPAFNAVSARYRAGLQHPSCAGVNAITFVAELGTQVVGFVDARLEQSPDAMHSQVIFCHIAEIAVRAEHRNRGIGRQLLLAAERWGREQGAEFASLEYHVANPIASALYEQRMGYRRASITVLKRL